MHITELPLLIFTILGQMSAGAFIVLGAIRLLARTRWGAERVERLSDVCLYAIGPTLVLGFAGSFLHLGNPMNAANALNHLESSGMSREILTGVLFAAVGAVYALCQYKRWGSPLVRHVLASITAVLGIVLVWMMASLYLLRTVPAWNTWITPASFFTTTLLLGSMAVAVALTARVRYPNLRIPGAKAPQKMGSTSTESADSSAAAVVPTDDGNDARLVVSVLTWVVGLAIVCLGITILLTMLHLADLSADPSPAASTSLGVMTDGGGLWLGVRALLTLAGTAILGVHLYRLRGNANESDGVSSEAATRGRALATTLTVVVIAFLLIFVGEVIGREMFYAAYARVGL